MFVWLVWSIHFFFHRICTVSIRSMNCYYIILLFPESFSFLFTIPCFFFSFSCSRVILGTRTYICYWIKLRTSHSLSFFFSFRFFSYRFVRYIKSLRRRSDHPLIVSLNHIILSKVSLPFYFSFSKATLRHTRTLVIERNFEWISAIFSFIDSYDISKIVMITTTTKKTMIIY